MNNTTQQWYQQLMSNTEQLAQRFGLDQENTNSLRDFVVRTAKEQYRTGNKAGAAWAFKQAAKTT